MEKNSSKAIFRSVLKKPGITEKIKKFRNTMRPPGNVPFVVDNLWEWKRPKGYPNRRYSVYASPQASLAKESGHDHGTVFRVELEGKYKVCQVIGIKDSKYHSDCKNLRKLLFKLFGQEWIDGKLADKEDFGKLWVPCLTKKEIYSLFSVGQRLNKFRDEIYESITYWNDVKLIQKDQRIPDSEGEIFFEPIDGYYLRNIEN